MPAFGAGVAQLVERHVPNVNVEGSSPFARCPLQATPKQGPARKAGSFREKNTMRRIHLAIVLCTLLGGVSVVFAQDPARTVVEKAIAAQGGALNLAKLRTMHVKCEGTMTLIPDQPGVPFTIEDTWQMPDQYKSCFSFQQAGKPFSQTLVINGNKGWMQVNGQTIEMPKEALAEMREQRYAEDMDRLGFLEEKSIELSLLDETKVAGQPAVAVLIKSKGHRDVKLYFDKVSGLLVKREHRLLDSASGKEVLQEVIYGDYEEKDGLKYYKKITAYRDGKQAMEGQMKEIEFCKKLDDKEFAKP
jgi:hypothetical protein